MNHDLELKLQAWLDGEMPADEAARFNQAVAADPEAQNIVAELKSVKAALAHNEFERKVPASREFYWSQIQRQIQREEAPKPARSLVGSLLANWRKLIVPIAGATVGVALLAVSVRQSIPSPAFIETTDTSSEFDALTYHDQSAGMTVVWLKFREDENANQETAPDFFDVP